MKYIRGDWKHSHADHPIVLYSELDESNWEMRKIEVYADGRSNFADAVESTGTTSLGTVPLPPFEEIASDPQFDLREISGDVFEKLWQKLHT